ncbi:hypothetical protein SDC9_204196 [bioreactor metagenome]|uniref:Uncharacterized protein n=1 Tax=bioreactor metagenome TaxID=1076179 RepID=A0A645IZ77_9ZZZZ
MGVARTTKNDALSKGELFRNIFNESVKGRYILWQEREKLVTPFLIEKVKYEEMKPTIINSLCNDKYGYIVEVLCGYLSTEFIVMQSDITSEICIAFCKSIIPSKE